jgi:hypothetical protein
LFVIDDDGGVVHAMTDDLRRRFGQDFEIVGQPRPPTGSRRCASWPPLASGSRC